MQDFASFDVINKRTSTFYLHLVSIPNYHQLSRYEQEKNLFDYHVGGNYVCHIYSSTKYCQ